MWNPQYRVSRCVSQDGSVAAFLPRRAFAQLLFISLMDCVYEGD